MIAGDYGWDRSRRGPSPGTIRPLSPRRAPHTRLTCLSFRRVMRCQPSLRVIVALGIWGACPDAVPAQVSLPPAGYAFTRWSTADGLPQNDVGVIAQDRDGYLWVGTMGSLSRFDGRSFRAVDLSEATAGRPDLVRDLVLDRGGSVWVLLLDGGVSRLLPDGRFAPQRAPSPNPPQLIAFGGGDTLWMATDAQLWLHRPGRWSEVHGMRGRVGLPSRLLADDLGSVWIAGDRGLARLRRGRVQSWGREGGGLPSPVVHGLAVAPGGGVWVATEGGIAYVSLDGAVERVRMADGVERPVDAIVSAGSERYWIASRDGVRRVRFDFGADGHIRAEILDVMSLPLDGSRVRALRMDDGGRLWIGSGVGLFQVRPLTVARLRARHGLPGRAVYHVLGDGDDGVWIASACAGLSHWSGGRLETFQPPALGMRSACVDALGRDRDGGLWIGQAGRFIHVDASGRTRAFDVEAEGGDVTVGPFLESHRGEMWFGSAPGYLGRVSRDGTLRFPLDIRGLPLDRIHSMAEDAEGALWVGQVGAVSRIISDSVVLRLDRRDGVPSGAVRALHPDAGGALWIASYGGGLVRFDPSRGIQRLSKADGFFDDHVSAIVRDRRDRLWILGDRGLAVVPREELVAALGERRRPREGVVFGPRDSMPEGNGGMPNAWLDGGQRVWLATVDGVASLDAGAEPFDRAPAPARIDEVRIDNVVTLRRDTIVVPPGERTMEIVFSAPDLDAVDRLRFRYRLDGHDPLWVEGESDRVARYARVAPGTYTFRLITRNVDGVESRTPVSLAVRVRAAWWQLAWVRALAVVAVLALLWHSMRWQVRRAEERSLVLEREIRERQRAQEEATRAASQLAHLSRVATAGELAASLAHELNQPLTAMMSNAQAARRMRELGIEDDLDPVLEDIVTQSERASDVVKSMRAFVRRQPPEATSLDPERVVLDSLKLVHSELAARGVLAEVRVEGERAQVSGDPVQLQQVVVNLVLNAADAVRELAPDRRLVTIRCSRVGAHHVDIAVQDRGPGITAEQRARLFEPFYTTKPTGLGIGLPLSRSIVEAHAGSLIIESVPDQGTVAHVRLPIRRS
jgi:signal transduction histidine kinase/ligand-binding sensor domain-containing protein